MNAYKHFTSNEIKPTGWLKRQLEIEADGLVGNLDKFWPDIRDSKWIGGTKEGWERVPYWLDGYIPLAYLLDDEERKGVAKRYIDAILERQKPDGWICPCEDSERANYDVWAVYLICKALVVYAECSGGERIEGAVEAALKNLRQHINFNTVNRWASARWFECLIPLAWLYERKKEAWIEDLARTLAMQGMNYQMMIDNFEDKAFSRTWRLTTHVVNLAMAIKCYAVAEQFVKVDGNGFANKFLDTLRQYHSTAYGLFTGDECLAGDSPVQGLELCAVVEAMYSFEQLFEVTGKYEWLDRLEKLAFNALPATVSNDMWSHQYDQQVNQISCKETDAEKPPKFTTNSRDAHIFGLEPNFGCCTSNMGQGFPKFALSTYYKSENGIVVGAIAPATLNTEIGGKKVKIECDTMYPFRNKVTYKIECEAPVEFTFALRVPADTTAVIDGKVVGEGLHEITKVWDKEMVELEFNADVKLTTRPNGLKFAERGNLLFSLPISYESEMKEYVRDGVERKFPYCDYELTPTSDWNYGFASDDFELVECEGDEYPFSDKNPMLKVKTKLKKVEWNYDAEYPDMCEELPVENGKIGDAEEILLYPYGCTSLRMTEMPKLK